MSWFDQVFMYCERGLDGSFWAEPFNAVSNAAFLIAAAAALTAWLRCAPAARGLVELILIGLVAVIGIGSFLFHTLATRWAALADVLPITVFMIAYLVFALRRFVGLAWPLCLGLLGLFCLSLYGAESIRCGDRPCLNGSIGYLPAFAAMALIGGWLWRAEHPAAKLVLAAAAVFAVSLTLRTLDRALCPATQLLGGRALGTHFLWHLANATLLYLLLAAAVADGRRQATARSR